MRKYCKTCHQVLKIPEDEKDFSYQIEHINKGYCNYHCERSYDDPENRIKRIIRNNSEYLRDETGIMDDLSEWVKKVKEIYYILDGIDRNMPNPIISYRQGYGKDKTWELSYMRDRPYNLYTYWDDEGNRRKKPIMTKKLVKKYVDEKRSLQSHYLDLRDELLGYNYFPEFFCETIANYKCENCKFNWWCNDE